LFDLHGRAEDMTELRGSKGFNDSKKRLWNTERFNC
jgi:hypothetical protein